MSDLVLPQSPSPWLVNLAYPLGSFVILPSYFGKIEVDGQENIPQTGPVIIASTHRSRWDALVVPSVVGKCVSGRVPWFMVTADEMTGLQGWIISRLGCFPVNTSHPGADSIVKSISLLSKGEMLIIFPEGDIYRVADVHPLKRGVARIALDVEQNNPGIGMKILPVSVRYSQDYPQWRTKVKVKIGTPLIAAQYQQESSRKATEQLTETLEKDLKELNGSNGFVNDARYDGK